MTYRAPLKSLALASQSAALLPLEEVAEHQDTPGVQVRHLSPPLMRPMAVASRASPAAGSAVSSVLAVLADFAD